MVRPVAALLLALGPLFVATVSAGSSAWHEGFDGEQPSWQQAGGDARWEIRAHRRVQRAGRTGEACEFIQVFCSGGTRAYVAHAIGRARVIDELVPSLWVKADRAGIELLVRAVLPRSRDPRTGRPLTVLIPAARYSAVGRWQQLRIEGLPRRLRHQVYVLRSRLGPWVDDREAYVDQIVLDVCAGRGVTSVWIDDLQIAGYVPAAGGAASPATVPPIQAGRDHLQLVGGHGAWHGRRLAESGSHSDGSRVALVGSVLVCDQRPMFPRIIQWNGESLAGLAELGFNAIWVTRLPSPQRLEEARELGLWIVCPPPRPPSPALSGDSGASLAPLGPIYDRILAWDMGSRLTAEHLPEVRRWAEMVKVADRQGARPLICQPAGQWRAYSRLADQTTIMLIGRPVLGTAVEWDTYRFWLAQRAQLARPGTPFWATVDTQLAPEVVQQLRALGPNRPVPQSFSAAHIRLAAYTAAASGARGLVFQSRSSLEGDDSHCQRRRLALELVNLELELIEPWLASGQWETWVASNQQGVRAAVLRGPRSRVLIPLCLGQASQCAPSAAQSGPVSFLVPGVPEDYRAYLVRPGGLRPLRRSRQTGGVRVSLEASPLGWYILMTGDPLVTARVGRAVAAVGRRAAELTRQLAEWELQEARRVITSLSAGDRRAADQFNSVTKLLQWSDGAMAARDFKVGWLEAERAIEWLLLWKRSHWERVVGPLGSPVASPAGGCFATLPWQELLVAALGSQRLGPNRLAGGDFEDVQLLLQSGWDYFPNLQPGLSAAADLAQEAAYSGRYGLRLVAEATGEDGSPPLESPPAWISSPAVPVEAGSIVVVRGWARVRLPAGAVDGLEIVDSLGGQPLALRLSGTDGWRPFTFYRPVPRSGAFRLDFVLAGLGEAWIDDVSVHLLEPPAIRSAARGVPSPPCRLPPTGSKPY